MRRGDEGGKERGKAKGKRQKQENQTSEVFKTSEV
jgi:hypothetical protein